jgi:23S rRNA pseudouridine2605 synthase
VQQKRKARRIGLARALSKLGYCSRSQAAELICAGRVQLNGSVRRDPETPVHMDRDRILVDSRPIECSRKIYLMMNKPRGLVTTASDEQGRETVYSILEASGEELPWLAPVGRLDKGSEGLLLLTNDSEWGARIAAPESHLEKTYHVQISAKPDAALLENLIQGVREKNELLRARRARLLRSGERNCWLEMILDEGKNRHIRRMFDSLGIEVLRLVRVAIGPLELGDLEKGSYRRLTDEERKRLDTAISDIAPRPSNGLTTSRQATGWESPPRQRRARRAQKNEAHRGGHQSRPPKKKGRHVV